MMKTRDMTAGSVAGQLMALFLPALAANALQQIYTMADTVIVGKGIGDHALAAMGNLAPMLLLANGFIMGLAAGFSVSAAQRFGAGDDPGFRKTIVCASRISKTVSVIAAALAIIFLAPVMRAVHTPVLIFRESLVYGWIVFAGLPLTMAYNLYAGILRAMGDSRTALLAIVLASVVNIMADCILIFGLKTGIGGAAASTVIAQGISAWICRSKLVKAGVVLKRDESEEDAAKDLLKNGLPQAFMNSITAAGCMVVQGQINGLGVMCTAAYSVCSRYLNFFMLPSLTAGMVLSAFAGQNAGGGKTERIRSGLCVCAGIGVVSYILQGVCMCFFPETLSGLMISEKASVSLAAQYMRICGAAFILLDLLFVFRGCVQGMGHPFVAMCSGIFEMVVRIPVIIVLIPYMGFSAAAWAEVAAWSCALFLNGSACMLIIRKNRLSKGVGETKKKHSQK